MNTATITLSAVLAAGLGGAGVGPTSASADPPPSAAAQAFALRMNGKSDEARTLLERALAQNEDDTAAWFELARTEFYHMKMDDAAEAIARAVELAPNNARYHHLAGVTATYNSILKHHDPKTRPQSDLEMGKAVAAFEKAVEVDPDFHKARIELINMLLKSPRGQGGDRGKARKQVEMLEAKDAVWGTKGRVMLENVSPKKAVKLWSKVAASHGARADAQAGLAKAYFRAGDIDQAVAHIDKAMRLDEGQRTLLLRLCRECFGVKDYAQAQEAVEQYLEQELPAPLRAYATFCLAQLQKMQGRDEPAATLLVEAEKIDPRYWRTYMEPGEVLFEAP